LSKRGVINPKDFFGIRRLEFEAPHLSYIDTPISYNIEEAIKRWIEENLKSRYYIGRTVSLTTENKLENQIRIGFEDPKELSYFALACPLLKYK
jgi:hypothetical protein